MKKAGLIVLLVLVLLTSGCAEKTLPVKEKTIIEEVKSTKPTEVLISCSLNIDVDYLTLCPKNMICLKKNCVKPEEAFAYPESDLPFFVDCSELDQAKQAECNQLIKYTEKVIYPILREMTHTNLSTCYKNITYQFIKGYEGHGVASKSGHIQFGEMYLTDKEGLINHFDNAHELFHVVGYCKKALDDHLFHQMMNDLLVEKLNKNQVKSHEGRLQEELQNFEGYQLEIKERIAANPMPTYYNLWWKSSECSLLMIRLTNILNNQKGNEHMLKLYEEMAKLRVSIPAGHPLQEVVVSDLSIELDMARIIVLMKRLKLELPSTPLIEGAFEILEESCGLK